MSNTIKDNAHTILLPAFADTQLSDAVKQFLSNGGCSILVGETREEYVAREMSQKRRQEENAEVVIALNKEARSLSGDIIVAVDQEISGICRLHGLVPPFPPGEQIKRLSNEKFEDISAGIAVAAKELGVNCFLGPILDIVTGDNPWLSERTWSTDPIAITEKSSAYIRGLQANGVAATAKHFPGYAVIDLDPAVDSEARNVESLQSFESSFIAFADTIKNGVEIVMTGPAIVEVFDSVKAASISPSVIRVLRERLDFKGVVMSDDLDAKAILRGQPITQVAIEALNAGSDFLLIADIDDQVNRIISAIVNAAESGGLAENRLDDAAARVRSLAARYSHRTYEDVSCESSGLK